MKHTLVIGSNRGIGLELCRQMAARGERVTATCRRTSPELTALSGVEVHEGVDVTDAASVKTLASNLGAGSVDSLYVVAGILQSVGLDNLDLDVIRRQMEVNAIGPLATTAALVPCLKQGAKVGLVTSRMGSVADNTSGGGYGYRMSKAALNMAGRSLSHDLRPKGISVRLLHPGWVRTEMTGGTGHLDATESAAGLIARMDELTPDLSGTFVHVNGEELPW